MARQPVDGGGPKCDSESFPPGLPQVIQIPSAWTALSLEREGPECWVEMFNSEELQEIEAAATPWLVRLSSDVHALGGAGPSDFPIPRLGPRLSSIRQDLLEGRGFVVLRGLPVRKWGRRLSAVALYGLGLHLGKPRPQNRQGHLLGHVRDTGRSSTDPGVRIYQTRERQTFHTDSADIVGLLSLQTARRGGDSKIVSSVSIYNEMRRRRPDLAKLLFEAVATDHRGEHPVGAQPFFNIPVFSWHEGRLSAIYQRQYIDSAQRYPDAPRLSPKHIEALNLFDALAEDPSLSVTMRLAPGDVQLLHSHTTLHDRTAFEDWEDSARRRHLLRLWLAPPQARPLPAVFAERYGSVVPGDRGGVAAEGSEALPLEELAEETPAAAL